MRPSTKMGMLAAAAVLGMAPLAGALAQDSGTSFFVTSVGKGDGANLSGLEGADAHCQSLAEAAGVTGKTWRAYLSTSGDGAVNARDRIGPGPWSNAKGEVIAASVEVLHSDASNLNKQTALDETGNPIKGRGDEPNQHDILTGSQPDGTAFAAGDDRTCSNWTSNADGAAMVGHHDRIGLRDDAPSKSWNSSHPSRGCSQEALIGTGGNGYFYCFAAE